MSDNNDMGLYLDYDFVVDPENIFARTNKVMELRIFIDSAASAVTGAVTGANASANASASAVTGAVTGAADFIEAYKIAISKHNTGIFFNSFYDAGFDLLCPDDMWINSSASSAKINFKVKCCAKIIYESRNRCHNTGFYMYPRSSLSKTPLRLANSVGIIDSGYRGNLIGAFDNIGNSSAYFVNKFDKLVQICAPSLVPIYVRLVEKIEDLGETTLRGCGGFGSTGK